MLQYQKAEIDRLLELVNIIRLSIFNHLPQLHTDDEDRTKRSRSRRRDTVRLPDQVAPGNRHPPCPTQSLQHTKMNTGTQTPKKTPAQKKKTSTWHLATATLPVPPNLCNTQEEHHSKHWNGHKHMKHRKHTMKIFANEKYHAPSYNKNKRHAFWGKQTNVEYHEYVKKSHSRFPT